MDDSGISREETQQLRELLNENLALAKENNRFLRNMRKWGTVAFWAKVVIWGAVLLLPVLLYSYFAPFLNILPGGAGNTSGTSTSLFGFPSPTEFIQLFHHSTTTQP